MQAWLPHSRRIVSGARSRRRARAFAPPRDAAFSCARRATTPSWRRPTSCRLSARSCARCTTLSPPPRTICRFAPTTQSRSFAPMRRGADIFGRCVDRCAHCECETNESNTNTTTAQVVVARLNHLQRPVSGHDRRIAMKQRMPCVYRQPFFFAFSRASAQRSFTSSDRACWPSFFAPPSRPCAPATAAQRSPAVAERPDKRRARAHTHARNRFRLGRAWRCWVGVCCDLNQRMLQEKFGRRSTRRVDRRAAVRACQNGQPLTQTQSAPTAHTQYIQSLTR